MHTIHCRSPAKCQIVSLPSHRPACTAHTHKVSVCNLLHSSFAQLVGSCRAKCDTRSTRRRHYRHTKNNVSDLTYDSTTTAIDCTAICKIVSLRFYWRRRRETAKVNPLYKSALSARENPIFASLPLSLSLTLPRARVFGAGSVDSVALICLI